MHCTIKNLTGRPVLVRLNSGQTRHLEGEEEWSEVLAVDVKDNARLQRLATKGVIRIGDPRDPKSGAERASPKEAAPLQKKKSS
jgi:hypothetical protein